MKILFYLPVVTRWWFDEIFSMLLRRLHGAAELHVIAAPLWRGTGLCGDELASIADLDRINWHIVDAEHVEAFRLAGSAVPGLVDLVHRIGPDLTLCRSADQLTPAQFPGTVRYVMEGAAAPFDTDLHWVVLDEQLFAHGFVPPAMGGVAETCADALGPLWPLARARAAAEPAAGWRAQFGLPEGRPVLAVPLQYEHEENLFLNGCAFPSGVALVRHLLDTVDPAVMIAISDHPLNRLHVDRSHIRALVAAHGDRLRYCEPDGLPLGPTGVLARHADAMLVDQSKSWTLAAFAGTSILSAGGSTLADWVHAATDLSLPLGQLERPDPAGMRRWYGWHLGARLLEPASLTLDTLRHYVEGTPTKTMIEANLARLASWHEAAA